jgi:hypothetical protein
MNSCREYVKFRQYKRKTMDKGRTDRLSIWRQAKQRRRGVVLYLRPFPQEGQLKHQRKKEKRKKKEERNTAHGDVPTRPDPMRIPEAMCDIRNGLKRGEEKSLQ